MTKIFSTHTFAAATAFEAAALFSMLSFGSSAEAAINLSSCGGDTAGKLASCCERLTAAQSPLWMIQSRTSCREAVVCGGRDSSNEGRCRIRIGYFVKEGGVGDEGNDGGDNKGRGPNSLR